MSSDNPQTAPEKESDELAAAPAEQQDYDMQAAAALVLERERERKRRVAARARRRQREQQKEHHEAVQRMRRSIEVIKWCVVGIATVMLVGLAISVGVLFRVQSEVSKIERQVDHVRESLRHPMQSLGASFGKELDEKLGSLMGTAVDAEQD